MIEGETLAFELIKCAKCSWRFFYCSIHRRHWLISHYFTLHRSLGFLALRSTPRDFVVGFSLSLWAQFISLLLYFWAGMIYARWKTLKNLIFPLSKKAFISARSARKFFAAYQIESRKKLSTEARMIYVNLCGWLVGKNKPKHYRGINEFGFNSFRRNQEEIRFNFQFRASFEKCFFFSSVFYDPLMARRRRHELNSNLNNVHFIFHLLLNGRTIYVAIKKCVTR